MSLSSKEAPADPHWFQETPERACFSGGRSEGELKMPREVRLPLPEEELAILRKWINEGCLAGDTRPTTE